MRALVDSKIVFILALIGIAAIYFLNVQPVFSLTSNQTNVTVAIESLTRISVSPTWINFTGAPGQAITTATNGSETLTIKNEGSEFINEVYAYVSTIEDETTKPYGSNNPASYSAGGVLVLKNSTESFAWLGRQEWNWTGDIPNKVVPSGTIDWGFFKNTTSEYFWSIHNSSGTAMAVNCSNVTGPNSIVLRIDTQADDGTSSSRDTSNEGSYVVGTGLQFPESLAGATWGIVTFGSGPLNGHYVAIRDDCQRMLIHKYDKRLCQFNLNADCYTGVSYNMNPGDVAFHTLNAWLPYGIPKGNLKPAVLTFEAG